MSPHHRWMGPDSTSLPWWRVWDRWDLEWKGALLTRNGQWRDCCCTKERARERKTTREREHKLAKHDHGYTCASHRLSLTTFCWTLLGSYRPRARLVACSFRLPMASPTRRMGTSTDRSSLRQQTISYYWLLQRKIHPEWLTNPILVLKKNKVD